MRNMLSIAALCTAVVAAGCIPSLHPLYTEDDLIFEPTLVGMWAETGNDDRWIFRKSGELEYELIIIEEGVPGAFEARLVQLGSHRFLDLYPKEPVGDNDFYSSHLIPVHTFYRFEMDTDTTRIVALDQKWLKGKIEAGEITIGHERVDIGIVLTASTNELQALVAEYADDPDAFRTTGPDPAALRLHRQ